MVVIRQSFILLSSNRTILDDNSWTMVSIYTGQKLSALLDVLKRFDRIKTLASAFQNATDLERKCDCFNGVTHSVICSLTIGLVP